uniref:Methyltransferase domain-containing protein n=1 Tax=Candidatus Kentrum sp. FM TaxID=2126340 RepID=A0A450S4P7_9GAMM|nr:MAG: Methyltransferase domain-containing protein [Candidatus Kentron sp. FM]VFJ47764.1 MAG: Methyltransferase domain-containing protein [Candidatus Kentron sp. FM]VFK07951.1 MAG: Methyltransferase domain-containing protein [Candidatus Kentron sp. FM]
MNKDSNGVFEEYDYIFSEFLEHFTGPSVRQAWTKSFIDSLEKKPLSLLSIGAGDGRYDESIFGDIMPTLDYFALEPNSDFIDKLTKRVAGWKAENTKVLSGFFDDTAKLPKELERKFDFILMAHCVYFMSNPAKAIERSRTLLTQHGYVFVNHQAESPPSEIFREFSYQNGWVPGPGRQCCETTVETISESLKKAGIKHFIAQRPAVVFVDEFFADRTDTESRKIIIAMLKFFLDINVENWHESRLEKPIAFIKERSSYNPISGRYELPNPEGFLVIPHPDNEFVPYDMTLV